MLWWILSFVFRHIRSAFLHCLFILWTAVDFLQGAFCLPVFLLTFMGAILFTFELNKSRRRSTESAEMLGVKDIAFINSALVFSLMHFFLTETDLQSVVTEINISKKILKWSNSSTSLITMDEMFRPLQMSKSRVCPWLCVGPYTCLIRSKVFKTVYTITYLKYSQGSDYFNGFLSTLLYQNYCIKTLIQSVNPF